MALTPLLFLVVLHLAVARVAPASTPSFDENYAATWGADGNHLVNQGTEIRLAMDKSSGAAFVSKMLYGSGFFHMRIKVPGGYTGGVITAYYLTSDPNSSDHDEVDFEFLGDVDGMHVTLQTNVFVNGHGEREQRLHLWFDPSTDFHDYKILWNPYQLVFFVDETPIRVLRNMTGRVPGYVFPTKPMAVRGSLWNTDADWATNGGKTKIDWNRAPFTAGFQGFSVDACANTSPTPCNSSDQWWNDQSYRSLTAEQQAAYDNVKKTDMIYDYCADKDRFKNGELPAECSNN